MSQPNYKSLSSMHFYGWKKGLKTGMYYLRTRTVVQADKVSISINNKIKMIILITQLKEKILQMIKQKYCVGVIILIVTYWVLIIFNFILVLNFIFNFFIYIYIENFLFFFYFFFFFFFFFFFYFIIN